VSNKPPRCDYCARRIRPTHHEFVLRDFSTGQVIGRWHTKPDCQVAAADYFVPGVALRATVYHPERCGGEDLAHCDGGVSAGPGPGRAARCRVGVRYLAMADVEGRLAWRKSEQAVSRPQRRGSGVMW
jgi:hypothetical protein